MPTSEITPSKPLGEKRAASAFKPQRRSRKWGLQRLGLTATMSAMPHLRIADLLANAPVDPEAHLDAARVERYAQMLDALPPVVVFNTPEGLLLVDGYHRVALRAAVGWRRSQRRCATARGK